MVYYKNNFKFLSKSDYCCTFFYQFLESEATFIIGFLINNAKNNTILSCLVAKDDILLILKVNVRILLIIKGLRIKENCFLIF